MIYFVPKEEGVFNKGDKIKVFMRKYNVDLDKFQEELVDDFIVENLFYDEKLDLFILVSNLKLDIAEFKEKFRDSDLLIVKEA
jgi:hypothetical protein